MFYYDDECDGGEQCDIVVFVDGVICVDVVCDGCECVGEWQVFELCLLNDD